jgi:hypothetical protein
VGGGYAEAESGISKYPLRWMLSEAEAAGARLKKAMRNHLVDGRKLPDGTMRYVAPDAAGPIHRSLRGAWWLFEIIPRKLKWRRWPRRSESPGFYIPWSEPRFIPEGALIHQSVLRRMEKVGDYRPANLPKSYAVEADVTPTAKKRRRAKAAASKQAKPVQGQTG